MKRLLKIRRGRTEEEQTVVPVEEPLGDVSNDQDRVGTGKLRQQTTHLQLEALCLAGTWDGHRDKRDY